MPLSHLTPAVMQQFGRVRHYALQWALLGSAVVLPAKAMGVTGDTRLPDLLNAIVGSAYSPVAAIGALAVPMAMAAAKLLPYVTLDILSRRCAVAGRMRLRFAPSVERGLSDMAEGFYRLLTLMVAAYLGLWVFVPQPCLLILAGTCAALVGVMAVAFAQEPAVPGGSGAAS